MTRVCSIAGEDDAAGALVLARSVAAHRPGAPLTVLVRPGTATDLRTDGGSLDVLRPAELVAPGLQRLLAAPPRQVTALLRPLLVSHLLEGGAEAVLLLPADAELYGPLEELDSLLERHDVVLVPRLTGGLPEDGHRPDGRDLLEAGDVDDEVVAVRRSDAGRAFVAWWAKRAGEAAEATALGRAAPAAVASPLAAAQRVFPTAGRLDDPGYNVSYWNLHERSLAVSKGKVSAGGRPLRLMRFHGFDPKRPWWLSEHATRVLVLDDPVLAELCRRHSSALLDEGSVYPEGTDRVADDLGNGLRFEKRLLRLHAQASDEGEEFGDLHSRAGAEAFARWLTEPAPCGADAGITRYAYDVWRERADVQQAYPDLDGPDGEGFAGCLWVHGRPELGL
jgi:hypothetical protein